MAIEVEIIKWIQQFASPNLDQFFIYVTMLGEEIVYIGILTLIYWCINKPLARRLLFGLTLSVWTNGFLKTIFNMPRPIGLEGIRSLRVETASGSSFPSGHTQTIGTFMFVSSREMRKKWYSLIGIVLTIMVAFSRVYLGVHWPKDVIGAIFIAVIIGHTAVVINRDIEKNGNYLPLFIVTIISAATLIFYKDPSYIKTVGLLVGYVIGYALEENFVNFEVRGSLDRQIIKYIIGMVGIIGIEYIFGYFIPETSLTIFLNYFGIMLWGLFIAPLLFVGLKLSRHRLF